MLTAQKPAGRKTLLDLIRENPRLLNVLHENGIHFCAGCYLTLSATPERAAAYHGVPNIQNFIKQVERAISAPRGRRRHC